MKEKANVAHKQGNEPFRTKKKKKEKKKPPTDLASVIMAKVRLCAQ